ncbi:MAG TPA: glycosyltransferase family 2 protein [Candidatus Acidoferrales bacterium]|nr:glycosyltransferase family 2 protein [Candidatus Acidoferrales bacterium]
MTASEAARVSIVVACRNEIKHIRGWLDSLLSQDMAGILWEAIIADGMSDDGTRIVLEEYGARHPQLRFIPNPGGIVSTGLNAAIRGARGEIIIRMDAHTSYAPDYCRRCVETLERTGADNVGGPARTRAVGARARAVAAAYHSRFSTGGGKFHDVNYEGWVDTLPYGCWRKTTLLGLGLFDEVLVRNQDDELNLRMTRAGGKIWQSPAIISWYSPRPTLSSLFHQYFQYGFWKVAVIRKHRLPGSWRHVVPIGFVLSNIFLLTSMAATKVIGAPQWFAISAILWLTIAAAYVVSILTASLMAAGRHGWATLPYLPAVFATYHFSYGLGCVAGLRWYFSSSTQTLCGPSVFTRITR